MESIENIQDIGKLEELLERFLKSSGSFVLKVVLCLAVFFVGRRVIAWVTKTVRRMMDRGSVNESVITFLSSAVKIVLYVMLFLWIGVQFGLKESSVAALVASGGVGIGLALQGGLSNLVGGLQILFFHPFLVGDYIIAQGNEGTVLKIELLHTTLKTVDNRRIIIPNGSLANDVIVNVTASEKRMLEVKVGISYEDSVKKAKSILERIVEEEESVLKEEERKVFVAELSESSVILGLRVWVPTADYLPAMWSFQEKIKEEFDREDIHIPYPQMEIHVNNHK